MCQGPEENGDFLVEIFEGLNKGRNVHTNQHLHNQSLVIVQQPDLSQLFPRAA